MYYAWKKELRSDDLLERMNSQRALRMWAVQTRVQYNFIQKYIRTVEGDNYESKNRSFEDFGGKAFNEGDFAKAAYWFSCINHMDWEKIYQIMELH
eukprot:TRINITY_DN1465_c0_g2_i1.p1 TRINITY_DN1465_c0_g2~~TRINITY_DN1465_c0_g2_i1.p1  ORF type:complete len:96 (+),score=19.29 TRINITY_DN1465_c0_g2_i1:303-590(+)